MANEKKEPKRDCFAYDPVKHNCKVLNECYCKVEDCKFFKTKEQFKKGREKYGFTRPY